MPTLYPGEGCIMSIEYIASISEAEYKMFRVLITTPLPKDYETWSRVRDRGKLRAFTERAALVTEIKINFTAPGSLSFIAVNTSAVAMRIAACASCPHACMTSTS